MSHARAAGALLAERHSTVEVVDRRQSLLNFAELARSDDWSLRSALVRAAQPEPVRAAAVLELVRRCEGALHPLAGEIERNTVMCDRRLSAASVVETDGAWTLTERIEPYPDARVADIARLLRDFPGSIGEVLDGYGGAELVTDAERTALGLLAPVLELDSLADELTEWSANRTGAPPVESMDSVCQSVFEHLERLGVARETPWPPGAMRRRAR